MEYDNRGFCKIFIYYYVIPNLVISKLLYSPWGFPLFVGLFPGNWASDRSRLAGTDILKIVAQQNILRFAQFFKSDD